MLLALLSTKSQTEVGEIAKNLYFLSKSIISLLKPLFSEKAKNQADLRTSRKLPSPRPTSTVTQNDLPCTDQPRNRRPNRQWPIVSKLPTPLENAELGVLEGLPCCNSRGAKETQPQSSTHGPHQIHGTASGPQPHWVPGQTPQTPPHASASRGPRANAPPPRRHNLSEMSKKNISFKCTYIIRSKIFFFFFFIK